ncbi:helix-turn-helix transcriptional regulator [Mucilaginibacter sp. JRF]|uniref:helix-turn-helix domain-containing protein n=1 Tax=Mucilaginibacter sp. JRF TaxID=2780088 RepID=UPI0018813D6B|nr:helix-turn-helix transcriptional regulator [Mucilaginibacter sp. JRF]MBE9586825.1 helix-turn-helix transcriptional regulator [Mucilaginibacter sp. JRF]
MYSKIKKVSANIRRIRESLNYSQDYVAMKAHISQNSYSKIELGYSKISLERFFLIADALGVDYSLLLEPND